MDAARLVSRHEDSRDVEWFKDSVAYKTSLPFSVDELDELHDLWSELGDVGPDLKQSALPDLALLPQTSVVLQTFTSYSNLSSKLKNAASVLGDEETSLSMSDV